MSLQLLPAPPRFSPTFSFGQHCASVTEPEGHRALSLPARLRHGVRFSPSPAPCPPSLHALVAPSVPSCCSRASGQRHLWYRDLARPPSSLPPDAESISKVSSYPHLLPCILLNPLVSIALCFSLSWPMLVLPDSPSAPSQLRYSGISTPASLLSHTTAGGLLTGSACVYLCTTVDLCESGDVPVGVCPSRSLLHPRSQVKMDSSIRVQPPSPCRAMGLPSPSPRWALAPNSDPLHPQS